MPKMMPEYIRDIQNFAAALGIAPGATALIIRNNNSTPNTNIDVDADIATLVAPPSGHDFWEEDFHALTITHTNIDITINTTTNGANGLDTGSRGNDAWYYIYIISNGTTVAGLVSTSATNPVMPSGYVYRMRVGAMRTDGSGNFYRIRQRGNRAQYVVTSGTNTATPRIISSTSSTGNPFSGSYTSFSVSSYVPSTATTIIGRAFAHISNQNHAMAVAPATVWGGMDSADNREPVVGVRGGNNMNFKVSHQFELILESSNIFYAVEATNASLACLGWVDSVNAG